MTTTSPYAARTLAAATPLSRDRYADFLRVFSIGVVVIGHWLMAVVTVGSSSKFVVGFAHYTALASLHRRGGSYSDFVRSRVTRLLRPTAVFIMVWLAAALALELTGHQTGVLAIAVRTVAQPLHDRLRRHPRW